MAYRDLIANPADLDGDEVIRLQIAGAYHSLPDLDGKSAKLHVVGEEAKLDAVVATIKKKEAVMVVKTVKQKNEELPTWWKNKHGLPLESLHCAIDEATEPPKAVEAPLGEVRK